MLRASLSRRTTDGTIAAPAWEFIAPAGKGVVVREVSVYLASAVASNWGLGRPAAKGVTPTTPVALLMEGGSDSPVQSVTALAWAGAPTVPAQFFRRITMPATIGTAVIWLFSGLNLIAGASLVLWNITANGVADVNIVADELP